MALFNDDNIRVFSPVFANEVGVNLAIVCQQVYGWCEVSRKANQNDHCFADEKGILRWWTYNTYSQWQQKDFPWWSKRTIERIFEKGRDEKVLISSPLKDVDGNLIGLWWTVDKDKCQQITLTSKWRGGHVNLSGGARQNGVHTNSSSKSSSNGFNTFRDALKGGDK